MDNVTHTLVGMVAGEVAFRRFARKTHGDTAVRAAFLTISALANNLPDFDLLYTRVIDGPLGYLLHHRGHTHTLLLSPLLAIPFVLLAQFILCRRGLVLSVSERRSLWVLGLLGGWLHLGFDFLNSYGVHPFWPVSGRWFYGDSVFIVEPLLWFVMAPALAFEARSSVGRILMGIPCVVGVVLLWTTGIVPFLTAGVATTFAAVAVVLARRVPTGRRGFAAAVAVLAISSSFALVGRRVESQARRVFDDVVVRDVAVVPRAADPSCWRVLVMIEVNGRLVMQRGAVQPLPAFLSAGDCDNAGTWTKTYDSDVSFWRQLQANNCWADAFLRFARFPVVVSENTDTWQVQDARFDGRGGFTAMSIPKAPSQCPRNVPDWGLPTFLR